MYRRRLSFHELGRHDDPKEQIHDSQAALRKAGLSALDGVSKGVQVFRTPEGRHEVWEDTKKLEHEAAKKAKKWKKEAEESIHRQEALVNQAQSAPHPPVFKHEAKREQAFVAHSLSHRQRHIYPRGGAGEYGNFGGHESHPGRTLLELGSAAAFAGAGTAGLMYLYGEEQKQRAQEGAQAGDSGRRQRVYSQRW
ncbi:hypothetical protein JCM10213_001156 [Rhodosporidiobolus nylandii]